MSAPRAASLHQSPEPGGPGTPGSCDSETPTPRAHWSDGVVGDCSLRFCVSFWLHDKLMSILPASPRTALHPSTQLPPHCLPVPSLPPHPAHATPFPGQPASAETHPCTVPTLLCLGLPAEVIYLQEPLSPAALRPEGIRGRAGAALPGAVGQTPSPATCKHVPQQQPELPLRSQKKAHRENGSFWAG